MRPLYQAGDRIEAQLLHDLLDRHLIRTVILGDALAGAAGELPLDIHPTLWLIDEDDREPAEAVLARFLREGLGGHPTPAWTCPHCGEQVEAGFALCWNCATPYPE
ncbi:MAG: DUF2007 domain-containing protein [Marichromatium sp.]|nr:DUF2007 domain-containing protein [Marichromatium sp.]